MCAVSAADTAVVLITNVADEAFAGTVTVAGTTADRVSLCNLTTTPAGPALPSNLTVPVALVPPTTDAGVIEDGARTAGFTVNKVWTIVAPTLAFKVTTVVELTPLVTTLNVVRALPAGIVTVGGT